MKEKGFTLIELLAVIVILSVITLITIPMITNVIEESKKKALASSIQGLVESANLYAIENDGVYEFLFDQEHKGSTKKGESLDYRGSIDGEGKLYLDREGNVSVCISNDTYYAYKNYNSGIVVGERKTGNCIIGFDALTNKYVAMLDNGTGNVSNVYSKDEVNNLVDSLDTKITNLENSIEELQANLNNYAYQSELEKANTNVENLSSIVNSNTNFIKNLDDNFHYSYDETKTSTTWVDGKPIYKKTIAVSLSVAQGTNTMRFASGTDSSGNQMIINVPNTLIDVDLSTLNIDQVIRQYGFVSGDTDEYNNPMSDLPYPITYNSAAFVFGWYNKSQKLYRVRVGEQYRNHGTAYITIEYTKNI